MSERPQYDPADYGPGGKYWEPDPENPMCRECGTRDSDWVELFRLRKEVEKFRYLLEECDIYLRMHAKPGNELKRDIQDFLKETSDDSSA